MTENLAGTHAPNEAMALVSMRGIVKRFGRVVANAGIDLDIRSGEIHALLGENGAGKTTLMNILYGLLQPDEGRILFEGSEVRVRSPHDAVALGIGMVHQHFKLVPTLTVAENMLLGEDGFLLRRGELKGVAARLEELGTRHGLFVAPGSRVWQLSVGEQQRVEILRSLYRNARVLVLDEPTAALAPAEVENLLPRLRAIADDGSAVVIITHHLDEVMACADRITVLRAGRKVATLRPGETSTGELARLMVGRSVSLAPVLAGAQPLGDEATGNGHGHPVAQADGAAGPGTKPGDGAGPRPLLVAGGLVAKGDRGTTALDGVDFEVDRGEIVALAGVEGNGQAELEEVLFGLRRPLSGSLELDGADVVSASPMQRLRRGMGLVPSDRYRRGVIRSLSVAENLVYDRLDTRPFGTRFAIRRHAILERAAELILRFSIKVSRPTEHVGGLSGGNAQRVVLARSLSRDLRMLVAAQPTRGLDVGAIEFVWEQLRALRDRGVGILLISTDLDEVLALADRCYVIYKGRLVTHLRGGELDRERVGLAMGGALGLEPTGKEV
jgi:ABC-type uncharacterized transport system ATPase subunit